MTDHLSPPRYDTYYRPSSRQRSQAPSNSNRGRVSTGTWISSSQFPPRAPPAVEPIDVPSPVHAARELPDHPYNSRLLAPAHEDHGDAPYYPQSITPTEAEHMTVQVEQRQSYLDGEAGESHRKRGTFVGGFIRRVMGQDKRESQPLPPDFAPGIVTAPSYVRNVTYVDTTEMPDDNYAPPPPIVDPDQRWDSELDSSDPATLRVESDVNDPHEPHESHEGTVVEEQPPPSPRADVDGTTAVHHNTTFMPAPNPRGINSPVYRDIPPTSDYDKMSAFHTAPSELYSLTSYIDRVQLFLRDLYDLPWTSSRIAADYVPGESSRSKYYRFKQRHPNNSGLALNSWYRQPTHQDLDLLASPPPQPGMRNTGQQFVSMGHDYNYPGQYGYPAPPPPADENGYYTESPRQANEAQSRYPDLPPPAPPFAAGPSVTWDPQAQGHTRPTSPARATSPRRPFSPPRSPSPSRSLSPPHLQSPGRSIGSPRSFVSPRTDRTIPTISHTLGGAPSSVQSPRTDVTIHTDSHTATATIRGQDRDRGTAAGTAGSRAASSPRTRQSWYSTESTPRTRRQSLHPVSPPPDATRSEGARSNRSAGRSTGRSPPTIPDGTMPVYLESVPASPPRTAAPARPRRNRYDHHNQFAMNSA